MKASGSALFLVALCLGVAPSLHATVSFSSGSGGGRTLSDLGNSLTFGGITATAWATDGSGNTFQTAALGQYNGFGLGVCSKTEIQSGAYGGSCVTSGPPEHAVGNELGSTGVFDFVLLQFSQPVTSISFALNPFGMANQEMDYTYFAGKCSPGATSCTPAGSTLANLSSIAGFGGNLSAPPTVGGINSGGGASVINTANLNLGSNSGGVNWILIGTADSGTFNDYFKLQSITYSNAVPEPATFGLAGAALAAIGLLRRKKRPAGL